MMAFSTYSLIVITCLVLCGFRPVIGARILMSFLQLVHTPSHFIGLSAIGKTLVARGHEVILVNNEYSSLKGLSPEAYTGTIFYKTPYSGTELEEQLESASKMMMSLNQLSFSGKMGILQNMQARWSEGCVHLFKDSQALQALKEQSFDMMLTLTITGCDVLLAEYLNIPFALFTPTQRLQLVLEDRFGIPMPTSYVPYQLTTFTDTMSFKQRVTNFLVRYFFYPAFAWYISRPIVAIKNEFNLRPDLTLGQMIGRADVWLCQSNFALEFAQPTGPQWIPIGGITVKPAAPLNQELETFVEGSQHHGTVIFSLGSATTLDSERADVIARIFSEFPQRFIWKHSGTMPTNLGNNTLVTKWMPQNDLLGHPKVRLMIAHGGINGIYEAVSHGVPLLVIPMGADRPLNAARITAKELGLVYNFDKFNEGTFRQALVDVLNDERYGTNMKKAAAIINDRMAPPNEVAAFWIEHVIKFGANHLRLRATELNFIQLNSLDVLGFFLVLFIAWIWMMRWLCRKCCSASRKTAVSKSKSD